MQTSVGIGGDVFSEITSEVCISPDDALILRNINIDILSVSVKLDQEFP